MCQNSRKATSAKRMEKPLALQAYKRKISDFKRSIAPIWLCLGIGIILCFFYLLQQLLFEMQSTENRDEQRFGGKNDKNQNKKFKINNSNEVKHYPKYYDDNLRSIWPFKMSQTYSPKDLHRWSEPNRRLYIADHWARGENGSAFIPIDDDEFKIIKKMHEIHNYNWYASENISVHRTLPDIRFPKCHQIKYPERLPKVSIIIIFHNEAWSLVTRTIFSIIDNSPPELLHEIILVDDVSTLDFLKRPLEDYIELLPVNIRIIRTKQREGLIRARLIGAKNATGSILVFFDAHMECLDGWLEPLVARIANDRSVVAVPYIDRIDKYDMSYVYPNRIYVNNLRWSLFFNWTPIPKREWERVKWDETAAVRTPTHVGCAFAIDREFFWEIGSYDEGMDIWGSENVEMAIRVWMCHGSLEILPCSRVGHLFRDMTYSFVGDKDEITARNNVRVVEVWLDEFKHFFYASQRISSNITAGDIAERLNLRKQLKCRSFRWYLENIYPESSWLKQEYIMMGEIRSASSNEMCLDLNNMLVGAPLLLWWCTGGENQFFAITKSGLITMAEEYCVGIDHENRLLIVHCNETDTSQLWTYDSERQWIIHRNSDLCLQNIENRNATLAKCNIMYKQFQWTLISTMPINETRVN